MADDESDHLKEAVDNVDPKKLKITSEALYRILAKKMNISDERVQKELENFPELVEIVKEMISPYADDALEHINENREEFDSLNSGGISPEILIAAWTSKRAQNLPEFTKLKRKWGTNLGSVFRFFKRIFHAKILFYLIIFLTIFLISWGLYPELFCGFLAFLGDDPHQYKRCKDLH